MDIRDLSVGDWVLDGNDNPSQILAIENWSDGYVLNVRIKDIGIGVVAITRVRPISITPEILEKNGFVLTGYAIQHNEKNRYADEDTLIVMSKNGWYCTVNQGFLRDISMYANSVHELQHIWRLAKIDKEITL